jgi:hypothetical protein
MPRLTATITAWVRSLTSNLFKIRLTWDLTVPSPILKTSAISALFIPYAIEPSTASSLSLSSGLLIRCIMQRIREWLTHNLKNRNFIDLKTLDKSLRIRLVDRGCLRVFMNPHCDPHDGWGVGRRNTCLDPISPLVGALRTLLSGTRGEEPITNSSPSLFLFCACAL